MIPPDLTVLAEPVDARLIALLRRWQAWPQVGGLPLRNCFDPTDMPHLLPQIILIEYDANPNPYRDYDALFRYIGTRIGEDFKQTRRTRDHMSNIGQAFAERWFPVHDHLRMTRQPLTIQGIPYLVDKVYQRFEILYLPLTRNDTPATTETATVGYALIAAHQGPDPQRYKTADNVVG
jgi:hypothetical protein